jgi:DNA polymerase elongation subunit (family B)
MANVCSVPLSYIFLRGQGIKIFSLVAKECRENGYLLPALEKIGYDKDKKIKRFANKKDISEEDENECSFEGAIVLDPTPGVYFDPIAVLDYSSLYPSSIISENLSHETYCVDKIWLGESGKQRLKALNYVDDVVDISFNKYRDIEPGNKNKGKKKVGEKVCRFVQYSNDKDGNERKGIIPNILKKLLQARKATRAKIKTEKDEFKRAVLDGLQSAYKITANSLYGQIGAKTSNIRWIDIAACTTAVGRNLVMFAKNTVEEKIEGTEVVYGDTDSVFVKFKMEDDNGKKLLGLEAVQKSIEIGLKFEKIVKTMLKSPHNLEYEKTFWPFVLLSKKRYVGNKYEFDTKKYKQTSMGIVLKRRDNAEIVKDIYGGVIDIIMNKKDIKASKQFLKESLMNLINGIYPLEKLVITKNLRAGYKDPQSIAHKVLADRMGERDPGNKPQVNDRIPYVYICVPEKKGKRILQGNRIEHPQYIKENKLKPDYKFYITNQIMKPVAQVFSLVMDKPETLFEESLRIATNRKNNVQEITKWFSPKKSKIN